MRHAKSDWDSGVDSDFKRPLNTRGKKAAPLMGSFIKKHFGRPNIIVSSPANRALTTAKLVAEALDYSAEIVEKPTLYDSDVVSYLEVVHSFTRRIESALLVGHNFTIEEFIRVLLTDNSSYLSMPTAAVACIDFDVEQWNDIRPGMGALRWHQVPREL